MPSPRLNIFRGKGSSRSTELVVASTTFRDAFRYSPRDVDGRKQLFSHVARYQTRTRLRAFIYMSTPETPRLASPRLASPRLASFRQIPRHRESPNRKSLGISRVASPEGTSFGSRVNPKPPYRTDLASFSRELAYYARAPF